MCDFFFRFLSEFGSLLFVVGLVLVCHMFLHSFIPCVCVCVCCVFHSHFVVFFILQQKVVCVCVDLVFLFVYTSNFHFCAFAKISETHSYTHITNMFPKEYVYPSMHIRIFNLFLSSNNMYAQVTGHSTHIDNTQYGT